MSEIRLIHGDCLKVLPTLPAGSFDAVVTDPPYDLTSASRNGSSRVPGTGPFGRHRVGTKPGKGFMGREWDGTGVAFRAETWKAVASVMKPGAYLLAFGGTRTFHRMACAIEDAGLVFQDTLCWLYGSGFPKHKSKLKPAWEPILMAWKPDRRATPLPGLDACRIGTTVETWPASRSYAAGRMALSGRVHGEADKQATAAAPAGRWPANVTLTCCGNDPHDADCAAAMLDEQSGESQSVSTKRNRKPRADTTQYRNGGARYSDSAEYDDSGGASRFFYVAKASRSDRGEDNTHPTVKPLALMRWLCRLISPPGGTILDPFAGSGSTLVACQQEGFSAVGIEHEAEYITIAQRRIAAEQAKKDATFGL